MTRRTHAGCIVAVSLLACAPTPTPGAAIFALGIDGAPGGALLSAWVEPGTAQRGWVVGGFVGVDPARIADGRVGRLLRYDRATLTTVCTTDRALWWVAAVADPAGEIVYACGEGGRVVRYHNGRCADFTIDPFGAEGLPTFWGLQARSATDVTLVGGSTADGPRGVLVHFDGQRFTRQEHLLPASARVRNLYKITVGALGDFVVGEAATLLHRTPTGAWESVAVPVRPDDNRLLTVSCDRLVPRCYAVGGVGTGLLLRGESTGWTVRTDLDDPPGLAGVWMQDANSIFAVGAYGFTMHTNTVSDYIPGSSATQAALHAVAGNATLVLAVGGELGRADPSQRAVLLTRGAGTTTFALDGQTYTARGAVRPTLGGGIGGGQ